MEIINSPWFLCIAGIVFCAGGVYLFSRNVFEEGKQILRPVLIMIAGVVLLALGMARFNHLI